MKKIFSFLSYHNAIPIAGMMLALGAGSAFAAQSAGVLPPPAPAENAGVSPAPLSAEGAPPDASYLVAADLGAWSPSAKVTSITEDSDAYYVAYAFSTIALLDGAWRPAVEDETMAVSKAQLGAHRDLGLYVAGQLQARAAQELSYLARVQAIERDKASGAHAAPAYAALIGKTLDADSAALPGYAPVVQNPLPYIPPAPAPEPAARPAVPADAPSLPQTPAATGIPPGTAPGEAPGATTTPDAPAGEGGASPAPPAAASDPADESEAVSSAPAP